MAWYAGTYKKLASTPRNSDYLDISCIELSADFDSHALRQLTCKSHADCSAALMHANGKRRPSAPPCHLTSAPRRLPVQSFTNVHGWCMQPINHAGQTCAVRNKTAPEMCSKRVAAVVVLLSCFPACDGKGEVETRKFRRRHR